MQLRSAGIDSQDEHRAILAAYRAKDVEAAVALMTKHVKQASDEAAEYLKDHFEQN
ncbi:FCD domain protein [compost metagenome]